jgi:hypothetical protein
MRTDAPPRRGASAKKEKALIIPDMPLEEILDRHPPQTITYFVLEGVSPMCCAAVAPESLATFLRQTGKIS